MKLPFFNRQRYVVLHATTPVEYINTYTPVALGKRSNPSFPKIGKTKRGLKTCYGHVASLKRSATVLSPCDFEITADANGWWYDWPGSDVIEVSSHDEDPQFSSKHMYITKLSLPWAITCNKPDTMFVGCSHILNDTEMRIPSGILSYKRIRACNIFNYIPKKETAYSIPFKKPLFSIYPLTDLPFYVESEYNPSRYRDLTDSSKTLPTFKNSEIHLNKS
jgi:hypothetical protein